MNSIEIGAKHDGGKPPMHLIAWDAIVHPEVDDEDLFGTVQRTLSEWWRGGSQAHLSAAFWLVLTLAGDGSPWLGLIEVARVLDFGARKYAPRNWEKGLPHSRTFAAAQRHLCARAGGQPQDEETGLDHYAHAACELMFALAFEVRGRTDLDDRPRLEPHAPAPSGGK